MSFSILPCLWASRFVFSSILMSWLCYLWQFANLPYCLHTFSKASPSVKLSFGASLGELPIQCHVDNFAADDMQPLMSQSYVTCCNLPAQQCNHSACLDSNAVPLYLKLQWWASLSKSLSADIGPRTIWHRDNLAPRTIWHCPCWWTIWHYTANMDNLALRTIWHIGQFDTVDNWTPWQFGTIL